MITRITVPHLDANIIDVTVTAWRKAPGDQVLAGEILVDLTTDKTTFELESVSNGTLLEILAAPKSVVPSGYILALLGNHGDADGEAVNFNQKLMATYRADAGSQRSEVRDQRTEVRSQKSEVRSQSIDDNKLPSLPNTSLQTPATPATRVRATPRARRLAQEMNLDLAKVQAETGAEVIDESVLQAYKQKQ